MKNSTQKKYAIAEKKKADLDSLNKQVQAAEYKVSELQSVVTSLQQKSTEFTMYLTDAETSRDTALSNWNLFKTTLNTVEGLLKDANTLSKQTDEANKGIDNTAVEVSTLINQLIYSGDIVNKFAQLVFKKKQLNPLISDELVQTVTTATADVNQAVAATLTALQSCYAAKGVAGESASLGSLELTQAQHLFNLMTGEGLTKIKQPQTPTILNTDKLNLLLENVTTAEQSMHAALAGKPLNESNAYSNIETLEKQLVKMAEKDIELREAAIDIEVLLNTAKLEKANAETIKTLEEDYKKAHAKFENNHSKLVTAADKLIDACSKLSNEPCSVTSAQDILTKCQALLATLKKQEQEHQSKAEKLLAKIDKEKDPREKKELERVLLLDQTIIALDKLLIKCQQAKLKQVQLCLVAANKLFMNADQQLLKANQQLSIEINSKQGSNTKSGQTALQTLLRDGYEQSVKHYDKMLKENTIATKQLDAAQTNLAEATHHLSSLKAGLSAATAAALAA